MESLRRHIRQHGFGYIIAIVATAAAVLVGRFALSDIFRADALLYLFLFAVMTAAWHDGLKAGLLATALGLLAESFFFLERDGWQIRDAGDGVRMGFFLVAGTAVSLLAEAMHRKRRRADRQSKRLEQLQEIDRRKDEFLATLSHELRNPLAPIRNALEILRLAADNKSALEHVRTIMERQVQQLVRLIDDLLDVTRITRGKLKLHKERVELAMVVRNAVEISRPLIEASGHKLTVTLPDEPIPVDADATRLAQVFSNLLNNAAKYSEGGGRIELTLERHGSDAVVMVKDTGVGISAEHLPHIFDMFAQVDHSAERSQGGLGIGLSLVKQLTEMHGGTVEARSEGHNKGSTFTVRLPLRSKPSAQTQPSSTECESKAAAVPCKVLIVDDQEDAAASMSTILHMMGHDVRVAHDGQKAVAEAISFRPDVVLLDLSLPKMSGHEVAQRIREQPWGKETKVVALSGWGEEKDKRRAKEAGFDHYIVKPVEPAALEQLLKKLCPASA